MFENNIFNSIVHDNENGLSALMENRDKTDTDSIIKEFNGDVTVIAADLITLEETPVSVIVVKEKPDAFFFGGAAFNGIVQNWLDAFNGNLDGMNEELEKVGGCTVHLEKTKTKKGRTYTRVSLR